MLRLNQQVTCRFAARQYFSRRDKLCECPLRHCILVGGVLIWWWRCCRTAVRHGSGAPTIIKSDAVILWHPLYF